MSTGLGRLTTEGRNPASLEIDRLSPLEIVRLMNAEDARVAETVGREAGSLAEAVEIVAERLGRGGRLIYVGAGTSGRLGVLDAAECPPTFQTDPHQVVGVIAGGPDALIRAVEGAEDDPERGAEDLKDLNVGPVDVVMGIATSGRTPYVLGAVGYARQQGAATLGLSCNPDSELARNVQLCITTVVGPEVISGSTRLKAGTATKLVLNTITTATMVRLGKTYGNLMVDLRATNQKLIDRSRRIVAELTGLPSHEAEALLNRCSGEVKTAIVAALSDLEPDTARGVLEQTGGRLRESLTLAESLHRRHESE